MEISPPTANSRVPSISESGTETSVLKPSDDQYFLLYLIMGTYFGPDLYEENPRKCAFHRLHEALPSYTIAKLSNSHIKTSEIESIYYHVLRKADKNVIVKREWLHQFFNGNLPTPENDVNSAYPQFPDLFPLHFHPQLRAESAYKTIGNVVFINNPAVYYFRPEIIERFKKLSGLEDFVIDRDEALLYTCIDEEKLEELKSNGEGKSDGEVANALSPSKGSLLGNGDDNGWGKENCNGTPMMYSNDAPSTFEPGMIFFPNSLSREDWEDIASATKKGVALTGTAVMGQMGPSVGLMDIGECDDSYLFRVSLPGVIRDERDFCCEVESDGKVLIRGVTTTGEKKFTRCSQEFEMHTQNLCPPGDFSISFSLPGPVDPQQFSGNFSTDGVLEGIVVKALDTN